MTDGKNGAAQVAPSANSITLTYPIEIDGRTIETIAFRRPKGRDAALLAQMRAVSDENGVPVNADAENIAMRLMIRAVTGLSEQEIDEIDLMADLPRVSLAASDFFVSITPQPPSNGAA